MVAYSFQSQFVDPMRSGRKCQTVRATGRRRHAEPGDAIQHYTGMRTKHCRLVGTSTCIETQPITMEFFDWTEKKADRVLVDGKRVRDRHAFAQADGFAGWLELRSFWLQTHGIGIFHGRIIRWKDFKATDG